LNGKVGYRFCQVIIVLARTKNGSTYEIQNLEAIMNIFVRSSRDPQKNGKRPPDWKPLFYIFITWRTWMKGSAFS